MGRASLKSILQRHQQGVKKANAERTRAENRSQNAKLGSKARRARQQQQVKDEGRYQPFAECDIAICLGEGDFSFANALITANPFLRVIATALDAREEALEKYSSALDNIKSIEDDERGEVLFGVNAKQLTKCKPLLKALARSKQSIARPDPRVIVVFNFPHLGLSESDQDRSIRQHQELMLQSFQSARALAAEARFALTLFDGQPYASWETKRLARAAGFLVERSSKFIWEAYPGYRHQLTAKGDARTSRNQSERGARTTIYKPDSETQAAEDNEKEKDQHESGSRSKTLARPKYKSEFRLKQQQKQPR